jgi:hypothetical protein
LRVRGVPKEQSVARRRAAASQVRKLARKMWDETVALSKVLRELEQESDSLKQTTDRR